MKGAGAASAVVAALIGWVRVERDGLTIDAVGSIKSRSKSRGRMTIVGERTEKVAVVVGVGRKSDLFEVEKRDQIQAKREKFLKTHHNCA